MNSIQLINRLKSVRNFCGVYARDQLPKTLRRPVSFIVNTDSKNEKGEHWVAFYLTKSRLEYFDPLGFPPFGKNLVGFINKNTRKRFYYSCKSLQNSNSTICGKYCIAFIKHRYSGKSYVSFINKFSRNTKRNDVLILNEKN